MNKDVNSIIVRELKKFIPEIKDIYKKKKRPTSKHVLKYLSSYYGRFSKIIEMITEIYSSYGCKKILDAGIAYGFYDIILKEKYGFNVEGLELPDRIKMYCDPCLNHGIKVKGANLLSKKLPYKKPEFDLIILGEILEHIPISPQIIFKRLKPYLKRKGYLIITTPNVAWIRNVARLVRGRNFTERFSSKKEPLEKIDTRMHVREYDSAELIEDLENAGYELDKLEMNDSDQRFYGPLSAIIAGFLPQFRKFILIRARKK